MSKYLVDFPGKLIKNIWLYTSVVSLVKNPHSSYFPLPFFSHNTLRLLALALTGYRFPFLDKSVSSFYLTMQ